MLDIEVRDEVAVLHMHKGHTTTHTVALLHRIRAAVEFVGNTRPIVLTGYRDTFAVSSEHMCQLGSVLDEALLALSNHRRPVVAAVNGDALDVGFALACAADRRLMARGLIGATHVPSEDMSHSGVALDLIGHVAGPFADSILLGAETFTALDAVSIGIVDRPTSPARLLDDAIACSAGATCRHAAHVRG